MNRNSNITAKKQKEETSFKVRLRHGIMVKAGAVGLAIVLGTTPVDSLADTVRETTANLRIRSQPTTNCLQTGLLPQGTTIITKDEITLSDGFSWAPLADGSGYIAIDYTRVSKAPEKVATVDTSLIDDYLVDYVATIDTISGIRSSVSKKAILNFCDQATDYLESAKKAIIECNASEGKINHEDKLLEIYEPIYTYYTNTKLTKKNRNATSRLLTALYDAPKLIIIEQEIANHYSQRKVYLWRQGDQCWSDIAPKLMIARYGCALTAVCVQIARSGLVSVDESAYVYNTATREGFNVASFGKALYDCGKLGADTSVTWDGFRELIPEFNVALDNTYSSAHGVTGMFSYFPVDSKESVIAAMNYWVNDCHLYPVVEGSGTGGLTSNHFCAVIEVTNDDVYIMDSADGTIKSLFDRWSLRELDYHGYRDMDSFGSCVLYKVNN